MQSVRPFSCLVACFALIALIAVSPSAAYPSMNNYYREGESRYDRDQIMDMLTRLENLIQIERKMENFKYDINSGYENKEELMTPNRHTTYNSFKDDSTYEKRALDLGLSRGYSGTLQAKHLIGLAAANYAGGPGRRRRDLSQH